MMMLDKEENRMFQHMYLSLVVVGMPNVGKSTIINSLRNIGVNKVRVAVSIL
jgi:ribosome biogenesis GTPase A